MKLSNFIKKNTVKEEEPKKVDSKKMTPRESPIDDEKQKLLYQSEKRYTAKLMENAPNKAAGLAAMREDVGTTNLGSYNANASLDQNTGMKS